MQKSFHKQTPFYKFSFFGKPERLREDSSQELELYLLDKSFEQDHIDSEFHQIISISDEITVKPRLTRYQSFLVRYSTFMDQRFEMIRLESSWLLLWNLLNFFSICYYFVISLFVIFIISVESNRQRIDLQFNQITKDVVACILFIDFFAVRYRIRVVHKGRLLHNHGQRLDQYLKGYFIIDLISLVILLVDIFRDNLGYFALIFSIKIFVAMDISQQIFYKLIGHKLMTPLVKFIRVLFMIAFFTFIFACLFVMIDLLYLFQGGFFEQYGFLWITSSASLNYINLYDNFSWIVWFQYALFMTLQMAVGCGYGRPTPLNPTSQFLFNVACLTCKLAWAYFTKQVIDIFTIYFQKTNSISEKIAQLNRLNQEEELTSDCRRKVRSYFRRQQENSVLAYEIQEHFKHILSEDLLTQFQGFYKQYFMIRFNFFKQLLKYNKEDSNFQSDIAKIIKGHFLHRNETLYRRNVIADENLFLSEWKIIEVSHAAILYRHYEPEWGLFGLRQFFIDKKPFFDVTAKKAGLVQYIRKEDFLSILKQYPVLYQKYFEKIQQLKIERQSTQIIQLHCWQCNGFHLYQNCPHLMQWFDSMRLKGEQIMRPVADYYHSSRKRYHRYRTVSQKVKDLGLQSIKPDLYEYWPSFYPEYNRFDFHFSR